MRANSLAPTADQRVIIFPAQTPKVSGKQVHFLFSVLQVLDVVRELAVTEVPFSPSYIEGIAEWRERVLPVISLEECLGLTPSDTRQAQRFMVVRMRKGDNADDTALQGVIKVVSAIRMVSLPIPCTPSSNGRLPRGELVRGIYEWDEGVLVVANMENILSGAMGVGG
jgi:purine-binding chemotaxis protein CheW